ncbi:MAG: tetratricopeptide repeat protein [Rhizomicrobium sp.]|jgi:lipoprotein NlpI
MNANVRLILMGLVAVAAVSGTIYLYSTTWTVSQNMAQCRQGMSPAIIAPCTAVIASGKADEDDLSEAHYNRGMEYDRRKQYALALEDFSAALRLKPDTPTYLRARGVVYTDAGQYALAVKDFDKLIAKLPGADAYNDRCWARAVWGQQLDAALADCNASLKLDNTDPAAQDSRALVYFRLGKNDLAIGDASGAIAFAPGKLPSSLYVRGLARLREGNLKDGKADVAAAEKLDPDIASRYAKWGVKPADGSAP